MCRPESVHEYVLTPHSLYAAVSVGLETDTIISVLNRLSKVALPREIRQFIVASTSNYGKVGLRHDQNLISSPRLNFCGALACVVKVVQGQSGTPSLCTTTLSVLQSFWCTHARPLRPLIIILPTCAI